MRAKPDGEEKPCDEGEPDINDGRLGSYFVSAIKFRHNDVVFRRLSASVEPIFEENRQVAFTVRIYFTEPGPSGVFHA